MITRIERIFSAELFSELRSAYISRARLETGRIADARKWMQERGFEIVEVSDEALLTGDGREVMQAFGKAWALRQEVHTDRREKAIENEYSRRAEEQVTISDPIHEGIATTPCPQMSGGKPCGGTLNRAPVCPSCVTGRMGYKYRYTCESCGCDIVTREELR